MTVTHIIRSGSTTLIRLPDPPGKNPATGFAGFFLVLGDPFLPPGVYGAWYVRETAASGPFIPDPDPVFEGWGYELLPVTWEELEKRYAE